MADDKGSEEAKEATGEAPPALDAKIRDEVQVIGEQLREARLRGQRSLFIHVLLMFLVSIVVFVIGTYFFVVPRVIHQSLDNQQLQQAVSSLNVRLAHMERAMMRSLEPEPAAPAEPDSKPALAPEPKAAIGPSDLPAPDAKAAPAPDAKAAPASAK